MNCDATVYTPATITVPATERKSAQISSLSLLEAASTCSLTSLTVCFFLLLLKGGPVLSSDSFLAFCSVFYFSVFSFSVFSFSQFKSGISFTGMQCCTSLLPSFLSSSYISATFASVSITFKSLLCTFVSWP